MGERIVIDPVTRIEGHARISIHLDDRGEVQDARVHVTELRGFERFCEGRSFREMPVLTARICGICPVSHLLASARAGDALLAVEVPAAARVLVALGDCAVTGNVTALRNALGGAAPVLARVYRDLAEPGGEVPSAPGLLPRLLDRVLPVDQVVRVDAVLPGCPPAPDEILRVLGAALTGAPTPAHAVRFG